MTSFWLALQFLTRLPTPGQPEPQAQELGRSLLFYPLVGLLIGALLWGLNTLLADTDSLLKASLLLCFWIGVTGALHLDGLADTADAWIGGQGNTDRMLAIMKDPYSGPVGVAVVVLLLLMKWAALNVLLQQENLIVLLLAPVLARASVPLLFASTTYVRAQGLGSAMAEHLPVHLLKHMVWPIVLWVVLFLGWQGVVLLIAVALWVIFLRYLFVQRIGGITGDTIGAKLELVELFVLLFFAIK